MSHDMIILYFHLHEFHVSSGDLVLHNTLLLSIYIDVVFVLSIFSGKCYPHTPTPCEVNPNMETQICPTLNISIKFIQLFYESSIIPSVNLMRSL